MLHLVRFAAGVVTGIVAMQLLKDKSTQDTLKKAGTSTKKTLEKAQDKLRDATVSSLEAIESASAKARTQLTREEKAATKKVSARKHEKIKPDQE
jgi:uncharacterized membrane-anchored protein YhcB (DUF1043 family)